MCIHQLIKSLILPFLFRFVHIFINTGAAHWFDKEAYTTALFNSLIQLVGRCSFTFYVESLFSVSGKQPASKIALLCALQ